VRKQKVRCAGAHGSDTNHKKLRAGELVSTCTQQRLGWYEMSKPGAALPLCSCGSGPQRPLRARSLLYTSLTLRAPCASVLCAGASPGACMQAVNGARRHVSSQIDLVLCTERDESAAGPLLPCARGGDRGSERTGRQCLAHRAAYPGPPVTGCRLCPSRAGRHGDHGPAGTVITGRTSR
jgi:hypothetical protein